MDAGLLLLFTAIDDPIDIKFVSFAAEELGRPLNKDLFVIKARKKKPRNVNYFKVAVPKYDDDLFEEHFRMSKGTFEDLLNVVGRALRQNDTILSVELRKKVLFTVWILAKPESFHAVGDRFGLAKSSGHAVFKQIVSILADLVPVCITWPSVNDYTAEANIFQKLSGGFPGIIGVIDVCHIPCKQPAENAYDYYNPKGFHSTILQGTCDHRGRFIDVFIGMPGGMHNARVFRNSPLSGLLNSTVDPLLPPNHHLIGDSSYPLSLNLMTPFEDTRHLTDAQTTYNIKLNSVRSIAERSFGLLKGKFRRLKFLDMSSVSLINKVIAAACVLHNFIIDRSDLEDECEKVENLYDDIVLDGRPVEEQAKMKRNGIVELFS